jgi:hypothetical protein
VWQQNGARYPRRLTLPYITTRILDEDGCVPCEHIVGVDCVDGEVVHVMLAELHVGGCDGRGGPLIGVELVSGGEVGGVDPGVGGFVPEGVVGAGEDHGRCDSQGRCCDGVARAPGFGR